jgi:rSAM/selenodomain-associated transferase 2
MLSVIIPTLNEGPALARVLEHVATHIGAAEHYEIIVCDGGSQDETAALARRYGARVLTAPRPGRAVQMNWAARHAAGEVLYFLHADTLPPAGFGALIRRYLARGYAAGCFRLRFDYRHWVLRTSGWASRFNAPNFQFGDQSLYMTRAAFEQLGGFDESLLLMEDVDIVGRYKRGGRPFVVMPESVVTSARKYRQHGVKRTELTHLVVFTLYSLRVKQPTIARWYRRLLR